MKKGQLHLIVLLALFYNLSACQNNVKGTDSKHDTTTNTNKMADKFDWNPGASGASFYPMEYSIIDFYFANGSKVHMPGTTVGEGANEWGTDQTGTYVGDDVKEVPVKLNITWLSYTENQFYTGSFDLPQDKMLALFRKGWPDFDYGTNKPITSTFNNITVGMAPGGMVVVWLSSAVKRVEVASFKANKTSISIKEFAPGSYTDDQTQYVSKLLNLPDQKEYLKEHGVQMGLWNKYQDRFALRPVAVFDDHPEVKAEKFVIDYYNGELENLDKAAIEKNTYEQRARIKKIYFSWYIPHTSKPEGYELELKLNEEEVMHAYQEVYGTDTKQQGELQVHINKDNDAYTVTLQNEQKKVQLNKVHGTIYLLRDQQ